MRPAQIARKSSENSAGLPVPCHGAKKRGPGQNALSGAARKHLDSVVRGAQMPARTSSNSRWISWEGGAVSRLVTTMHRQENRKAGSSS